MMDETGHPVNPYHSLVGAIFANIPGAQPIARDGNLL